MFDALPDINPKGQQWPPQVGFEPTTPEEKKLAAELRTVADKELLKMAGPVAQSPIYAGVSEFANTLGLNIPRNSAAAARTLKTGRDFSQEYDFLKNVDEAAARQSPKASTAGMVGGAIGQALALAPEAAPTWIGRAAQGAGMGGGLGYASEAMDSKDAQKAAQSGLFGALGGGIGTPVAEGIGAAAAAAGRPIANTLRGLVRPDAEAARRVGAGLASDFAVGGENLNAAQAAGAGKRGQELVVADFGGETTRALARSAANTSPEARIALGDVIERRFSTQGDRTGDFVNTLGSGQSAVNTLDQLQTAARNANKPAYARAYNDPAGQAVWNQDLADFGGETTRALARSAANTSPEARIALGDVIERRFSTQGDRTGDFVNTLGSGQSAVNTLDQLQTAARNANKPAYARAYNDPAGQAVWNQDLADLMQAPAVQDAIRSTMKTGANKAAAQGFKAPKNPFVEDANGNFVLRTNPNGSTAIPNIQFWDYVQRDLRDASEKLARAGETGAAGDIKTLRGQLTGILDKTVPAFGDARTGAAKFFGAEDALDAGKKFVTSKLDNAVAAKQLSKMSKAERNLFAEGFVSEMVNNVRNIGDRQTVINKIYNTPNARQRVQMALGPEKAKELEAFLHIETVADRLRNAVGSNSTTIRQLAEMGLAGGGSGALLGAGAGFAGGGDSQNVSAGAVAGALLQRGTTKIDARVARKVGDLLASSNPDDIAKIVKMATKNSSVLKAIKNINLKMISASSGAIAENQQ